MKKIFNFILVLTLCAMPLFITGCSKTRAMHFETTYIVWNESGDKLNCTYGMSINNETVATYFNVKNFEVILSKDNRGSGATVEYISNESSSLKQQFLYISPQSDNNFIKIGFSVDESWKLGEIKIMCFDKEIYVGKVGVSE